MHRYIVMIYFAEFAAIGTMELADEILISAESKADARSFALRYASNWGIDLYSLSIARKEYLKTIRHHHSLPQASTQRKNHANFLNAGTPDAHQHTKDMASVSVVAYSPHP